MSLAQAALVALVVVAMVPRGARTLVDSPRLVGSGAYQTRKEPYVLPVAFDLLALDVEPPMVTTPKGPMKGSIIKSRLGRDIYSFRGIRYVQAPVGPLRFQPPQPAPGWEGVYDASEDGAACPQENGYEFPTNEDCLFLNVYTTVLPTAEANPKRPVFLYVHMGGWYGNNARSDNHGPQYIMDQDMVVVTFNYRLGALGLLSTGDGVLLGNYGMKDQVAAMRWVQENIASFGGDPSRVTLVGYSAGAAAVWFHLASPMSRGLFQQAIAMSSSINAQNDMTTDRRGPMDLARRQAKAAGCPHYETSQQIKDCLMQLPAQNISGALAAGELFDFGIDPVLVFYPVIEPCIPGVEHFLTEDVTDIFVSGRFAHVPFITGRTRDEFDWRASTVYENENLRSDMDENWNQVAPYAFLYPNESNSDHISEQLRQFYMKGGDVTLETVDPLGKLYSDAIIGFGIHRNIKLMAALSTAPMWYYEFDYQGRFSYQYRGNTSIPYGVMHQDDVMYMFYLAAVFEYFTPDAPEIPTVERLTKLWYNFVTYGHPTPSEDPLFDNVIWNNYSVEEQNFLSFGDSFQMSKDMFKERMEAWERLFPMPLPHRKG